MAKFCKNCGSRLDQNNVCPVCGPAAVFDPKAEKERRKAAEKLEREKEQARRKAAKKVEKKAARREKRAAMSMGQKVKGFLIRFLVLALVLAVLGWAAVCGLQYLKWIDLPAAEKTLELLHLRKEDAEEGENAGGETAPPATTEAPDPDLDTPYTVPMIEAESYLNDLGTIAYVVNALESDDVRTEEEVYDDFYERGFTAFPITSHYTIEGEYYPDERISSYGSNRHPVYETVYETEAGVRWIVSELNGVITASPETALENASAPLTVVSENENLVSYDCETNRFYMLQPSASLIRLVRLPHIDAEALESLQIGG